LELTDDDAGLAFAVFALSIILVVLPFVIAVKGSKEEKVLLSNASGFREHRHGDAGALVRDHGLHGSESLRERTRKRERIEERVTTPALHQHRHTAPLEKRTTTVEE